MPQRAPQCLRPRPDCDCIQSVSAFSLPEPGAVQRHLPDPEATDALGRALAPLMHPGMLVTLDGPLGSGKTALVRSLLHALGHAGRVRSPTYTLVEPYELALGAVYHFDFYRFAQSKEADDAGFREYFDGHALCLVEWPERARAWLPRADLAIRWLPATQGRTVMLAARPGLHLDVLSGTDVCALAQPSRRAHVVAGAAEPNGVDLVPGATRLRGPDAS